MTQQSFWWKQLNKFVDHPIPKLQPGKQPKREERIFLSFFLNQFQGGSGWLLLLFAIVAMLFWNWKLLLATSTGVGAMVGIYLFQGRDWQTYWLKLRQFFSGTNRQLTLAVTSGGMTALCTYMAASIWVDAQNHWLATGAIIQGLGILLTLVLLVWQIITRYEDKEESRYDRILANLTQPDSLQRLIAVRKLTRLAKNPRFQQVYGLQVAEYFRLMLTKESEEVIREAILDALQVWDNKQIPEKSRPPLQMPINLKRTTTRVHRRV
ncbi:MAG: hypothetical protein WBG70_01590 [Spirulinaceae cyanobacterium]